MFNIVGGLSVSRVPDIPELLHPEAKKENQFFDMLNPHVCVVLQPWMVYWKERRFCVFVNWPAVSSSCPRWLPPTVL